MRVIGLLLAIAAVGLALPTQASPVEDLTLSGSLSVVTVGNAGQQTTFKVEWHDGNAADYTVEVRFGDGKGIGSAQFAECVAPVAVGDEGQTFEVPHKYARRGTYAATLTVSTRECWTSATGLGNETITRRLNVKVR